MMKYFFNAKYYLVLFLFYTSFFFSQTANESPIPANTNQMILVLTDSIKSTSGNLYRFERTNGEDEWSQIGNIIPIVLGRNGLAWGRGLHQVDSAFLPVKKEGDGKSPAGVFTLSYAFGYKSAAEMEGLKMPYMEITAMLECIDDINSEYYNQLVNNNEVEKVDWESSEKMFYANIYYEQGVVVDQNIDPIVKGLGSCIFLHNWSVPDETSAGCTEMEPKNMREVIYWLDYLAYPVLVQLTQQLYTDYQKLWQLPEGIEQNEW